MKILLVYPKYIDTFWSFKDALKFISKSDSPAVRVIDSSCNATKGVGKKS